MRGMLEADTTVMVPSFPGLLLLAKERRRRAEEEEEEEEEEAKVARGEKDAAVAAAVEDKLRAASKAEGAGAGVACWDPLVHLDPGVRGPTA